MHRWPSLKHLAPFVYLLAMVSSSSATSGAAPEETKPARWAEQAMKFYRAAQWNEARDSFQRALTKPMPVETERIEDYLRFYLAMSYLKLNENNLAKAEMERMQKGAIGGVAFEARFELAKLAIEAKQWSAANKYLSSLQSGFRSHQRYPEVLWQLLILDLKRGQKVRACKWATQLYTKYPWFTEVQDWTLDLASNKVKGQRLGCPANRQAQISRIRHWQWSGQSERARAELEAIAKAQITGKVKNAALGVDLMRAQFLINDGAVDEAVRIYLKRYEEQKDSFAYLTALGNAAARAGEAEAAIGAYYRAYKFAPTSKNGRQALFQSAFLSYRFQDYDSATRKFTELSEKFSRSGLSRDAKWYLAWLRYLKNDYQGAYASFEKLREKFKGRAQPTRTLRDLSSEKLLFWMALSSLKMGEPARAQSLFQELSQSRLLNYYSIVARYRSLASNPRATPQPTSGARTPTETSTASTPTTTEKSAIESEEGESEENLNLNSELDSDAEKDSDTTESEIAGEERSEPKGDGDSSEQKLAKTIFSDPRLALRFERAQELRTLGLEEAARWELQAIERRSANPVYLRRLIEEYQKLNVFDRSSYLAQTFFAATRAREGIEGARPLWEAAYPKAFKRDVENFSQSYSVPSELVWGIMRAESQYRPEAISSVGALGLMQMMPFTARQVSEIVGVQGLDLNQLTQPTPNIKLGTRYLRRLMDNFKGQIPLVAAGYNAGPHRVSEWLYSFGNLDMDEFIEHIPFVETRNYVKKVVTNYEIYKALYSKDPNPQINLAAPVPVKISSQPPFRESWDYK